MQSLKCRIENNSQYPMWNWPCEDCGSLISFFSVAPPKCLMCNTPIGFDGALLVSRIEERIKYHVQD